MLLSKALLTGSMHPGLFRWLSVSLLGGMLLGCGQTGPLYLPPEPVAPEAEIDTVAGAESSVAAGVEAGVEADVAEGMGGPAGDAAEDSDVVIDAPDDVVIEPEDEAAPAAGPE